MKIKINHIILILIITLILAFAGCADFDIQAEITNDNFVSFSYTLKFSEMDSEEDLNYEQLQLFLLEVQTHWEENGAECEINLYDDGMELIGRMEKQCDTKEQAFNTLYEYMTNEITVFDNVSLTYNEVYEQADYKLSATLDLTGIVDEQIYEVHPSIVDEDVDEFIENLECTVSISLPFNDSADAVEITQNEVTETVTLDAPANIEIEGVIKNNEMVKSEQELLDEKSDLENRISNYRLYAIIAAVLAIAVIAAIVLLNVLGKKNKTESAQEQIADAEVEKASEEQK